MDGGRRRREEDPDALAERVLAGDRRAVARAISLAEDEHPGARRLLELLYPHAGKARTLGITGPARGRQVEPDRRALQAPARRASRRSA